MSSAHLPMDPEGPTGKLCLWIESLKLSDIPISVQTRAKYLMLDGIGCALLGAHLPWSEKAANVIIDIDGTGESPVFGWEKKISPMSAALLNSTFIQGFELDDWHSEAPLHSNSIILPALFAALATVNTPISGEDFLLAYIVGLEIGPRVGKALYGPQILSHGWHSGAVFGPSASAGAVSKLLKLPANQIEDALGIACTQACGLMSAQFESEVKRMQHGFAARNGLMAAMLANGGYIGIKKVYEREYGGFLKMFSSGNGKEPNYLTGEITEGLGQVWKTTKVNMKPYSSMAGTHPTIDCIRKLQEDYPEEFEEGKLADIESILLEMGDVALDHGGWKASRPLTSVGAQMSNTYVAATQLVDRQVLPAQFRQSMLERDDVWELVNKTNCQKYERPVEWTQRATVVFKGGRKVEAEVESARGVKPELSNDETVEKYEGLMKGVIDEKRRDDIQKAVLELGMCADMNLVARLLQARTESPIA